MAYVVAVAVVVLALFHGVEAVHAPARQTGSGVPVAVVAVHLTQSSSSSNKSVTVVLVHMCGVSAHVWCEWHMCSVSVHVWCECIYVMVVYMCA